MRTVGLHARQNRPIMRKVSPGQTQDRPGQAQDRPGESRSAWGARKYWKFQGEVVQIGLGSSKALEIPRKSVPDRCKFVPGGSRIGPDRSKLVPDRPRIDPDKSRMDPRRLGLGQAGSWGVPIGLGSSKVLEFPRKSGPKLATTHGTTRWFCKAALVKHLHR